MAEKKRKNTQQAVPVLSRNPVVSARPLDPWAGVRIPASTSSTTGLVFGVAATQAETAPASRPASKLDDTESFPPPKKAKINNTVPPSTRMSTFITQWAEAAQRAILEREAGPVYPSQCPSSCKAAIADTDPLYRCFDCYYAPIECKACVVASHARHPFHRVEEWDPALGFWQRRSLYDLGMVIQLGEMHSGSACYTSLPPRKTTVIHEHGIHAVAIKYCRCRRKNGEPSLPDPLQLISFGLFPGSWDTPETAFSINALRDYHLLSLQSPITATDYVAYLRRNTDSVQPDEVKDRYRELNTTMREFTFLRSARRAHQAAGRNLPSGSLAVLCPACPHPTVNMAVDWEHRSDEDAYLDMLFYSVDGNFHHSQKMKPMDPEDFPLTQGAAYFVDEHDFAHYQERMKPPKKEESSCNKFAALGQGKYTGRVSGMVGMTCSRHMFVIANSLVDLLKGEGFAWGDFSQLSGLQPWLHTLKLLCRGYDVNCQYDKKFAHRLAEFRKNFSHLTSIKTTDFPPTRSLIPKFHAPAHIPICSVYRSYNYTPGVGMTDGEASERIWSAFNALAIRTKEMSAGHRHDVINDFHGDMNVRRVHSMPQSLARKHRNACEQLATASAHLIALESNVQDKTVLANWREVEADWERDVLDTGKHKNLRNPYVLDQAKGLSEKQLIEMMDTLRTSRGSQTAGPLNVLHQGTVLERIREQLLDELESEDISEDALASLRLRCEEFATDAIRWSTLRDAYMAPLVAEAEASVREKTTSATSIGEASPSTSATVRSTTGFPLRDTRGDTGSVEKGLPPARNPKGKPDIWQELYSTLVILPSSYAPTILRERCMHELVHLELEIRHAQARDALDDVRTAIVGREAYKIKKVHANSKQRTTRATEHIRNMEADVREAANRYRRARIALVALGMDESDPVFRPLRKGDTVKFTLDAQHRALGESRASKPWIWEKFSFSDTHGNGQYQSFYDEARRVHWFRSSATRKRWQEEVRLLQEEMGRSMRFFAHQHDKWTGIAQDKDRAAELGPAAYARRQAYRYTRLLDRCRREYAGKIDLNDFSCTTEVD